VLAPPLAALALYEGLIARAAALQPAFAVRVLSLANDVIELWDLLLLFGTPMLALLAAIALVLWLRRRVGWARALLTLWWLLGAGAAWIVWIDQGDLAWLTPEPAVQARVLEANDVPPRGDDPGGVAVTLGLRGLSVVYLQGARHGSIERCDQLDLRMARGARGRYHYVIAWSVAASAPAAAAEDYSCGANSTPAVEQ